MHVCNMYVCVDNDNAQLLAFDFSFQLLKKLPKKYSLSYSKHSSFTDTIKGEYLFFLFRGVVIDVVITYYKERIPELQISAFLDSLESIYLRISVYFPLHVG